MPSMLKSETSIRIGNQRGVIERLPNIGISFPIIVRCLPISDANSLPIIGGPILFQFIEKT